MHSAHAGHGWPEGRKCSRVRRADGGQPPAGPLDGSDDRSLPSDTPDRACYIPTIRIKENEPFDVALRRFKRTIKKAGIITELRAREFYEKPTAERKRKKAAAVKRHYKRLRSQMLPKKMY